MNGRAPRLRRHGAVAALYHGSAGRAALRAISRELPAEVVAWLARLRRLHAVPFANLVPDARALPAESIRFFAVDHNWLDSLVDGALSVANGTAAARAAVDLHRSDLTDRAEPPIWTGFLLRSAAVAGWPGLSVAGYADRVEGDPLPLLRLDRPAPSVLIAIFDGFIQRVEIATPAQGLHFGVERPGRVRLRYLGGGSQFPSGEQPPGNPCVDVPQRDTDRGVLDVGALVARLTTGLAAAYDPVEPPPLGAGGFAVEMIAGAERKIFVAPPDLKGKARHGTR